LQHDVDAAIAKPASFRGYCLHGVSQKLIIRSNASVTDTRPIHSKHITRPPLAQTMHLTGMSHSLPLRVGRYHFFAATSFKTAMSSIDSANSF
jgi:hypothetical protein